MESRNQLRQKKLREMPDKLIPSIDLDPPEILVAEDDREMRQFMAMALADCGYRVCEARDGIEALEALERREGDAPFDALIVDMWMPGLTGLDIMDTLRSKDWSTPVVFVSGFVTGRVHEEAERLGAFEVLPKPFRLSELVDTVEKAAAPVWR
ncbi:MAG: response regulator [Persicimonas sp.]